MLGAKFGWTELFIGVIIVAIVGNAAEHVSAITMAVKNKMEVSVEIAVGSTLQVAMFVAPYTCSCFPVHASIDGTSFHMARACRDGYSRTFSY